MDNLPVEIAYDIISRLLVHAVLRCRQVCKTWRDFPAVYLRLTHHHHNRRNDDTVSKVSTLGLVFLMKSVNPCHPLHYGEFDENNTNQNEQRIQNAIKSINHPHLPIYGSIKSLIGSCNGLICLAKIGFPNPIHIFNPITREYLYLQGYNENNDYQDVSRIYTGFGYSPQTKEYKVVRILYNDYYGRGVVQVYTLGGGNGWRNTGVLTSWLYEQGVFANGAIYWLGRNGKDIMAFNLSDEKFHALPAAPFCVRTYRFTYILGSFGDWLCVTGCGIESSPKCLDIWTFKKLSSKMSIAATGNRDESWSWCKEFSITLKESFAYHYRPLAVTKSGLFLLKYKNPDYPYAHALCSYDPKTATMKSLDTWKSFEAIPHTNSFVSLEALGETTCKKKKLMSSF